MPTNSENTPIVQAGHNAQLLLIALGVVGNLLLGAVTVYTSRLQSDIAEIEAIARTGAANASLIARDVEHLTKWSVEEIRAIKERLRAINEDRQYMRR